MWLKYDILIQIRQAFISKKHDYSTAKLHNWFLLFGRFCKWRESESWGSEKWWEGKKQKPEDTTRRCDYHVAQKKKQLLNGYVFIPPNKLISAALKRSEEGNDWPQKILLSAYLTINRSRQTVYQQSTKCHFILQQRVWWPTECKQTDCFNFYLDA